ncbi:uncharacterized protein CBL_04592 [Carabus blaptoides fortunei]
MTQSADLLGSSSVRFQRQCSANQVYLVGHHPPGADERQRGALPPPHTAYSDHHNRRYLRLIRKYADIIVGQFFGHLHSDTFRIIYNEKGRPISWAMVAPSVSPRRTSDGPNNPGLRLYKFDTDTGQILDFTQFFLDLTNANKMLEVEWIPEYNFTSHYGLSTITPLSLHNLADKFTQISVSENTVFSRYYVANSVRVYGSPAAGGCDISCAHTHYCAITRVDFREYRHCLETAASALASASSNAHPLFFNVLLIAQIIVIFL